MSGIIYTVQDRWNKIVIATTDKSLAEETANKLANKYSEMGDAIGHVIIDYWACGENVDTQHVYGH